MPKAKAPNTRLRRLLQEPTEHFTMGKYRVKFWPSPRGHYAFVHDKNDPDDDNPLATIPTDKSGRIPKDAAILRLMEVSEGDRKGRTRNVMVDIAVQAQNIAKAKPKTEAGRLEQYLWWMRPNESDIDKIDTPDADWTLPKTAGRGRTAVVVIGTKKERDAVQKVINRSFTNHERRLMHGLVIRVQRSAGRGIAGYYRKAEGLANYDEIVIAKPYLFHDPDKTGPRAGDPVYDDTAIHELIHFLRARDPKRTGLTASPPRVGVGDDRDIQEALADAETVARMKMAPWRRTAGYYRLIKGDDPHIAATHDRQILANVRKDGVPKHDSSRVVDAGRRVSKGTDVATAARDEDIPSADLHKMWTGSKGLRAAKTTDRMFPNLRISKANIQGRGEAIDTYWRLKGRTGGKSQTFHTHIFAPRGNPDPKALRQIASPMKGLLVEFRDGRPVKVSTGHSVPERAMLKGAPPLGR